jgi:hypothetical protein
MERWKTIPGYRAYQVSDHGAAQSMDRVVGAKYTNTGRRSSRLIKGKTLTTRRWPDGTPCVNLWRGGVCIQVPVRRLVMVTFVGPQPRGMDAVNIDGDTGNNHLSNLQWAYTGRARAGVIRRLMEAR